MKRVLVTGINGQLGYDVVRELNKRGIEAIGVDRERMDLTNSDEIEKVIYDEIPDGIIHCAAYTAVDDAEDNIEICEKVNALAVKYMAICAKNLDIPMVYISTDYVFDGSKDGIYVEEDVTCPINVYGRTKCEGEEYIREILDKYFIVRISWVFGKNGNNFIETMLRLAKDREELNVIHDQVGSPTYTKNLAPLLIDMIESEKYGTYHATNDGYCSWYEFAKVIFEASGVDIKINPITTDMYPSKAKRPFNSRMSKNKLVEAGFNNLGTWESAVKDYITNLNNEDIKIRERVL